MELSELKKGLEDLKQGNIPPTDKESPTAEPWLNMDNLMSNYGQWFDSDKGLGEMLLSQLRTHGVDTQAATEAMLRELLTGLVDDLNLLQQKLTGFTSAITQQMQNTQAVADSVQAALDSSNTSPSSVDIMPPDTGVVPQMNDFNPDSGFSPDSGASPDMGAMPPDTESTPDISAMPQNTESTPDMSEMPPVDQTQGGTVSDSRMKKKVSNLERFKGVVSDERAKTIFSKVMSDRKKSKLNPNILSACSGGF